MPGARSPWSGVGTLRAIHYTHMDSHMTVALPVTHIILGEEFDTDELRDIAEHGANTGVHGFTYSSDLHDMFDKYEEQIMDDLDEYCEDNFAQSAGAYIAEQLTHDDRSWTLQQFKEYACWMYLEMRAWFITGGY